MKISAVLFDFDGVIANTLTYHVSAWQKVFSSYQVEIYPNDIFLNEGQFADEIARILVDKKGLKLSDLEIKQLTARKRELYREFTQAKIYPGVEQLIVNLKKQDVKIGLVTGSIIQNVQPVVGDEFLENFEVIITGDVVEKNKPHPEPYLMAAKRLNVQPENCVVIENAPLGIRAAKLAGMYCIAVKSTIKDESILKEADLIAEDISKIPLEVILQ